MSKIRYGLFHGCSCNSAASWLTHYYVANTDNINKALSELFMKPQTVYIQRRMVKTLGRLLVLFRFLLLCQKKYLRMDLACSCP